MKIRQGNDGSFEAETKKGIFGFNSWSYSEPCDTPLLELFDDGVKVGELKGSEAIELYEYLTPDSDGE